MRHISGERGAEDGDGSHTATVPEPGSFHKFVWDDGKDYVCQIIQTAQDEGFVQVEFWKPRGRLWFLPSLPEKSWEDLREFMTKASPVQLVFQLPPISNNWTIIQPPCSLK